MPDLPDFDPATFWEDSNYARDAHTEAPPSDELIRSIEDKLGYKLPAFVRGLVPESVFDE